MYDMMMIYIYIYVCVVVDRKSFFRERPFFADRNVTFAKLTRTPHLSFVGPMLSNMKIHSPPAK